MRMLSRHIEFGVLLPQIVVVPSEKIDGEFQACSKYLEFLGMEVRKMLTVAELQERSWEAIA